MEPKRLLSALIALLLLFCLMPATARADAEKARADTEKARADAAVEKLKQGKIQLARQMKADGMDVETIAKYTGLTVAEIDALK